jgi:hypothetical protein
MNEQSTHAEYLVLSRGQWDKDASKENIETAIHEFYDWLARNIDEGKMKMGSRLSREHAVVSKAVIATDGPFGEAKEVGGGYWFIVARSLREAANLAAQNPCAHASRPSSSGEYASQNRAPQSNSARLLMVVEFAARLS